jgi:hypothetical protein
MTSILKWAAIAAGAYWLYESGLLSSFGLAPAATSTGSTAAPPPNPAGAPPTNTATTTPTKSLVLAAAQSATGLAAPLLTFDQWNAYYQRVRGIAGPDPGIYLTGASRTENLSIDEWWGDMQQSGFSGFVRSGMGGFVTREMQYTYENPFTPPPEGLVSIPRV